VQQLPVRLQAEEAVLEQVQFFHQTNNVHLLPLAQSWRGIPLVRYSH